MGGSEKQGDTFIVRDLETLRIISDSLRWQILEALWREVLSPREIAERLGLATSKIYYHLGLLEQHGLIEVAETRMVANLLEKRYRAASRFLDIDPALTTFLSLENQPALYDSLASTLIATRDDMLRSLEARLFNIEQGQERKPEHLVISRSTARIPESRAQEFRDRLAALIHEFEATDDPGPTGDEPHRHYAMTLVFYPSFYYSKAANQEDAQ